MAGEINFGLLDPNAPAKVGNAFFQGQQEARQAQQDAMQNKLAQLSLGQKQQEIADSNRLNDLYRSATGADGTIDASKLYSGAAQAGLGSKIPAIQKNMVDLKKSMTDADKEVLDLTVKKTEMHRDQLSDVNDPQTAAQWVASGFNDPQIGPVLKQYGTVEQALSRIPTDPTAFQQWKQQQALGASKFIEQNKPLIQTRDTGGTLDTLKIDPATGAVSVLNSIKKTQSPDSKAADARQSASGGGIDTSTPEGRQELDYWAEVVRKGGQLPPGLARGKDGSAFVREVTKRAALGDTTPDDLMNNQAEFGGKKAGQRTLGNRQANIEMAATEAYNLMPIAVAASQAVDRSSYPTLNKVLLAADRGTGDEKVVQLAVATNSLVNAYTRAISPTGNPTMSDKDHARQILDDAYSKGQYAAAVNMMQKEIEQARKSPNQVRADMRGGGDAKPTAPTKISSDADYAALPSGAEFIAPDGSHRRKP